MLAARMDFEAKKPINSFYHTVACHFLLIVRKYVQSFFSILSQPPKDFEQRS